MISVADQLDSDTIPEIRNIVKSLEGMTISLAHYDAFKLTAEGRATLNRDGLIALTQLTALREIRDDQINPSLSTGIILRGAFFCVPDTSPLPSTIERKTKLRDNHWDNMNPIGYNSDEEILNKASQGLFALILERTNNTSLTFHWGGCFPIQVGETETDWLSLQNYLGILFIEGNITDNSNLFGKIDQRVQQGSQYTLLQKASNGRLIKLKIDELQIRPPKLNYDYMVIRGEEVIENPYLHER